MPRNVDHYCVAVVEGVHRVEHVARIDVEPANIRVTAHAAITPTRGVIVVPTEREGLRLEVEDHGQVEEEHVVAVTAKSCIITERGIVMGLLRTSVPVGSITWYTRYGSANQ